MHNVVNSMSTTSSAAILRWVCAARDIQSRRYAGLGIACNAQLPSGLVRRYCPLSPAAETMLRAAFDVKPEMDICHEICEDALPGHENMNISMATIAQ